MLKTFFSKQNILPLLTALIWGTSFVAQSMGAETMQPFAFNFVRNLIAALFLWILSLVFDKISAQKAKKNNEKVFVTNKKDLLVGGVLCGVALTFAMNLQQCGVGESGAGKAGFITALYVVLVPIFGLILKKHVPKRVFFSAGLAVVGLYLLCIKEGFTIVKSDFLLLCCAFMFAIQIMIVDHYIETVDGIKLSCVQFLVVGILSGVLMLIFEEMPTWEVIRQSLFPLIYTAIFSSGIAYTLQIVAQRKANPTVLSIILSLESVVATISGAIILGEKMIFREYVGCIIMFAAVIISQVNFESLKALSKKNGKEE